VEDLVADRVVLLVLDDHRPCPATVDLQVEQGRALGQQLAQRQGVDLEGEVLVLAAAVDHAGHEAVTAQTAVRARSALWALLDG
jgi:hypothetical protein